MSRTQQNFSTSVEVLWMFFVKADGGRDFARRANELRMATAGGRRPPLPAPCAVCMGGLWPPARSGTAFPLCHSERPFCHSERSEESVTPVFVRDRNTPSVTFGDSSLGEGAKDEGCGFDRLWPQNDVGEGRGSSLRGARRPGAPRGPVWQRRAAAGRPSL